MKVLSRAILCAYHDTVYLLDESLHSVESSIDSMSSAVVRRCIGKTFVKHANRGKYDGEECFLYVKFRGLTASVFLAGFMLDKVLLGYMDMEVSQAKKYVHARMAGWPAAFEAGMKSACSRHLGDGYSILLHGHSTGGPFVSMLSQRVPNVMGVVAIEASPFGYIQEESRLYTGNVERRAAGVAEMTLDESRRQDPFDELSVRTWRDEARYAGPEAAVVEGASALMRLPELMEDVMASWDRVKVQANFKCEYPISRNVTSELRAAAIATARRLGLDDEATDSLIDRYVGMTRELAGPDVKPVPPTLFGITQASRDHPEEVYRDVILPLYEEMDPSPRTALTTFGAGMHEYAKAEADLAFGVAPSVITGWDAALNHGFFD